MLHGVERAIEEGQDQGQHPGECQPADRGRGRECRGRGEGGTDRQSRLRELADHPGRKADRVLAVAAITRLTYPPHEVAEQPLGRQRREARRRCEARGQDPQQRGTAACQGPATGLIGGACRGRRHGHGKRHRRREQEHVRPDNEGQAEEQSRENRTQVAWAGLHPHHPEDDQHRPLPVPLGHELVIKAHVVIQERDEADEPRRAAAELAARPARHHHSECDQERRVHGVEGPGAPPADRLSEQPEELDLPGKVEDRHVAIGPDPGVPALCDRRERVDVGPPRPGEVMRQPGREHQTAQRGQQPGEGKTDQRDPGPWAGPAATPVGRSMRGPHGRQHGDCQIRRRA